MRKILVHIIRWAVGGLLYGLLEVLQHGYTHWSMILLAAILCIPLDLANNHIPWDMPLVIQAILGGLTITAAELVAGLILNIWLGLDVWNYSGLPGNLWGQICPEFAVLWVLLAGMAIVLFDWMDYWIGGGDRPHYRLI